MLLLNNVLENNARIKFLQTNQTSDVVNEENALLHVPESSYHVSNHQQKSFFKRVHICVKTHILFSFYRVKKTTTSCSFIIIRLFTKSLAFRAPPAL